MHDVFISYSFENKALADRICHELEAKNVRCWYAPRDVTPGMDYREAIMAAIEESKCLVLLYTKASNKSKDVRNEITAAFKASCPILPFRVDDVQMEPSLAYYLNGVHWLDAVSPPMEKRIGELYDNVVAIINKKAPPTPPVPPPKKKTWIFLLALLLVCGGIYMAGLYARNHAPVLETGEKIFLWSLEGLEPYRYSYFADTMFSQDGDMYFLENTETDTLTLVKTDTGDILQKNIPNVFEHPEAVSTLVAGSYDVMYFMENFFNGADRMPVVRIFDRKQNVWIREEGIHLWLKESEYLHQGIYNAENKAFRGDIPDGLHLLIYDEEKGCLTKAIVVNPDGSFTETDISDLGLIRFLTGIKKTGLSSVLMMDREMRVCVYDTVSFTVERPSWEELREEYLPYAVVAGDRQLSRDGRYLKQTEYANNTSTVVILDLEKREERYRETFAHNYNVFFTEEDRALGYEFTNGEGRLFSIDLTTGRTTQLLDSSYFRRSEAFLNVPFAFAYSEELKSCLFVSQTLPVKDKPITAQVTVIAEDGQVVGYSNEVEMPFEDGWVMPKVQDGKLFLFLVDNYPERTNRNGISTTVYYAEYNIDPDGTVGFLK